MRIVRLARQTGLVLLAMVMLLVGAWCSIAVWYRAGVNEPMRDLLAGATLVLVLFAVGVPSDATPMDRAHLLYCRRRLVSRLVDDDYAKQ